MAYKGRDIVIQASIGGTYTAIAGMRSKVIRIDNEPVDITTDDSAPWRQLLSNTGARTLAVSGTAIFADDLAMNTIEEYSFSGLTIDFKIIMPNSDYISGSFLVGGYAYSGEFNGAQIGEFTILSVSDITLSRSSSFYDDFNDNSFNVSKWTKSANVGTDVDIAIKEQNSQLEIRGTGAVSEWAGITSTSSYTVSDGDSFLVKATLRAGAGTSPICGLFLENTSTITDSYQAAIVINYFVNIIRIYDGGWKDTSLSILQDTEYLLEIKQNGSNVEFYVDSVLEYTSPLILTTVYPTLRSDVLGTDTSSGCDFDDASFLSG